ncbi:hypothetical protein L211DRAFT_875771 [Terfezia boudieri ATCC MYA-4762]|uniref:Uncharacterized protein n=1 Tax=Terfezia boudieri ATCC MYA-4762 TaxID=1051890 RepID=A0A3N4L6V5_9PEZI|nr:hypothetical protein L211DRAFT_875771 [Terfezia boudieri ATCC MYA-4762]
MKELLEEAERVEWENIKPASEKEQAGEKERAGEKEMKENTERLMLEGYEGTWRTALMRNQISILLMAFHDSACAGHYTANNNTYKKILEVGIGRREWSPIGICRPRNSKNTKKSEEGYSFSFNSKIGQFDYSPFELLYGYQPRSAIQNLVLLMELGRYEDKMVFLRNEKLDKIRHLATKRQLKAWEHRVEQYQAKLRDHHYLVGDLVLFQNYAKRHKPGSP